MATTDVALSPSPHGAAVATTEHTPSNASSPLSDVEDKEADADAGEMELDIPKHKSSSLSNVNLDDDDDDDDEASIARSRTPSEIDSNLSEVDINDSEAETERLYDTPPKAADRTASSGAGWDVTGGNGKHFLANRDRAFEPSPSKLKQQLRSHAGALKNGGRGGGDDESLSGHQGDSGQEEGEDDNVSEASSGSISRTAAVSNSEDTTFLSGRDVLAKRVDSAAALLSALGSDGRKRKRSTAADLSESDQPLRKRTGSVGKGDGNAGDEDAEDVSTNPPSGDQSEPDDDAVTQTRQKEDQDDAMDEGTTMRKPKRHGSTTQTASIEDGPYGEEAGAPSDKDGGTDLTRPDRAPRADDDRLEVDLDEEAEAASKNEEELERKKAAFEQLQAIEKHFAMFRDRLYEDRLAQLNEEESTLVGDNPSHPEYLAMMECVDARRAEKRRIIDLEHHFNLRTLKRWGVARRGQIHAQFFQGVREKREIALEDLGKQWYQIQQCRRRHANTIPDYGFRFPTSKTQHTRDAVAYNKEVSLLAGIAKHEGFPAAPHIRGATGPEIDDDFEEIARARHGPHLQGTASSSFQELSGLSFSLGAAGHQYLADTPWANPNHPLHRVHRQQDPPPRSPVPTDRPPGGALLARTANPESNLVGSHTSGGDVALLKKPQLPEALESGMRQPKASYGASTPAGTVAQAS